MNPDVQKILSLGPCDDAAQWIMDHADEDSYSLWRKCTRGDWLLWTTARVGVDRKLTVLAACDCAETALRFLPSTEKRPAWVIATARAWCRSEAAPDLVRIAPNAACAYACSSSADAAYAAAAYAAADATADVAATCADAAANSAAAAYGAAAFAATASASAAVTARASANRECARLVRKRIPWRVVRDALRGSK